MTKVIGINCHSLYRIIGITLWSLTTVGLGIGMIVGHEGMSSPQNVPPMPRYDNYTQSVQDFDKQLQANRDAVNTNDGNVVLFYFSLVLTVGNIVGIWCTVNNKYRFVE